MPISISSTPVDHIYKMDDIAICQIHAGGGDGADILLDCNDNRISVSIFPSTLPVYDGQSDKRGYFAEDQLINLLNRAVSIDIDDDECEEIVDETWHDSQGQ